jgi:hypothetical protein
MLKQDKPPDVPEWLDAKEKLAYRVQRATKLIERYAEVMGWSVKEAKRRIDVQRLHVLNNPVREIPQEYDL